MDTAKDLKIQFSGLKEGIHTFSFTLDASFLKELNYDAIDQADFRHKVVLEKSSNLLIIELHLAGSIGVDCDRCGNGMQLTVEGSDRFFVKFGIAPSEDDQIEVLDVGAHTIDLSERVYQLQLLSIPLRKVHAEEDCDPSALALLEEGEFEEHLEEEDGEPEIDPRWNALKELNKNK